MTCIEAFEYMLQFRDDPERFEIELAGIITAAFPDADRDHLDRLLFTDRKRFELARTPDEILNVCYTSLVNQIHKLNDALHGNVDKPKTCGTIVPIGGNDD